MSEIPIKIPDKMPVKITDKLIKKQIAKAIKILADATDGNVSEIKADIESITLTIEKLTGDEIGIYAEFQFKSGGYCTVPLVYVFENKITLADEDHMFWDGECGY